MKGCGHKIGPYDCCTVVCGDCLELMKALPDGCVDAVVTDPPYGANYIPSRFHAATKATRGRKSMFARWGGVSIFGDDKPFDPSVLLKVCKNQILWGAARYADKLQPLPSWLIWDKRVSSAYDGVLTFPDCDMAWCSDGRPARIFRHIWNGFVREGAEAGAVLSHPTQKPIALMIWCLGRFPTSSMILDPFLGSGTTAVAAKKLGRHFLGFEISPEYCRIAEKRIALVEMQPQLFRPEAQQLALEAKP